MTSIVLALDLIRVRPDPERPTEIDCTTCGDTLVVHQPDERSPGRLLGACPDCGAWFLIDADADVMVKLPDESALRDA